jgi:hypothetical protein
MSSTIDMLRTIIPKGATKKKPALIDASVWQHEVDKLWHVHFKNQKNYGFEGGGLESKEEAEDYLQWMLSEYIPRYNLPIKITVFSPPAGWMVADPDRDPDLISNRLPGEIQPRYYETEAEAIAAAEEFMRKKRH